MKAATMPPSPEDKSQRQAPQSRPSGHKFRVRAVKMQMAASADVDMVRSYLRSVSRWTVSLVIAVVCSCVQFALKSHVSFVLLVFVFGSPCHSLFFDRLVRVRLRILSSQGVGVSRSLLPTSLFEHLSRGQAANPPTQRGPHSTRSVLSRPPWP